VQVLGGAGEPIDKRASDLSIGDRMINAMFNGETIKYGVFQADDFIIDDIKEVQYNDFVYDVETSSHYFMTNGVRVHNCDQIDLEKLFKGGFSTGHGFLREPSEIRSYAALACIAIQSNQNDMHKRMVV
jgi:ribonucleoside-triphosphate reductase